MPVFLHFLQREKKKFSAPRLFLCFFFLKKKNKTKNKNKKKALYKKMLLKELIA